VAVQERGVDVSLPSEVEGLNQKVEDITRLTHTTTDELKLEILSLRLELVEVNK
jgi:hypothetical protein